MGGEHVVEPERPNPDVLLREAAQEAIDSGRYELQVSEGANLQPELREDGVVKLTSVTVPVRDTNVIIERREFFNKTVGFILKGFGTSLLRSIKNPSPGLRWSVAIHEDTGVIEWALVQWPGETADDLQVAFLKGEDLLNIAIQVRKSG